jgi:hypothetical protein
MSFEYEVLKEHIDKIGAGTNINLDNLKEFYETPMYRKKGKLYKLVKPSMKGVENGKVIGLDKEGLKALSKKKFTLEETKDGVILDY